MGSKGLRFFAGLVLGVCLGAIYRGAREGAQSRSNRQMSDQVAAAEAVLVRSRAAIKSAWGGAGTQTGGEGIVEAG
jgi:hypothetical protein